MDPSVSVEIAGKDGTSTAETREHGLYRALRTDVVETPVRLEREQGGEVRLRVDLSRRRPHQADDTSVLLGPVHQEIPVVAPVSVDDVAWCFAEAIDCDAAIGEIYNLAGPDRMTMPQMLLRFRDEVPGAKPNLQPRGVPDIPAALGARLAKTLRLDAVMPFDEGMARMGALDSVASLDKPEAHLGWTPSPFDISYAKSL